MEGMTHLWFCGLKEELNDQILEVDQRAEGYPEGKLGQRFDSHHAVGRDYVGEVGL